MSEDDIKPVAWVERNENGHDRMWSYSLESWAHRPASPEPLYDQSAIDRLKAEIADANGKIDRFMGAWERFRIRKNSEFWEMKEECDEAKRKLSVAVAEVAALKHLLSAAMEKEQTNG